MAGHRRPGGNEEAKEAGKEKGKQEKYKERDQVRYKKTESRKWGRAEKLKSVLVWLTLCLLVFTACSQTKLTYENVDDHITAVGATVKKDAAEPMVSSVSGEWAVLGLVCSGQGDQARELASSGAYCFLPFEYRSVQHHPRCQTSDNF